MRDFSKLTPLLNSLIVIPNLTPRYDLFADALVWTDELPSPEVVTDSLVGKELRGVWQYRTSLILGKPNERCRADWEEASRCFPDWPGFDPVRQDAKWAPMFREMQARAMSKWEEFEHCVDAELARKAQNVT